MRVLLLLQQSIQMVADMRGLRRRVSERDRFVERDTRFVRAAELVQPRAFRAEEMKVTLQLVAERLDHLQRGSGTAQLCYRDGAIEGDDRRGLQLFERAVQPVDLLPIGVCGARRARVNGGNGRLHLIWA